MKKRILSLLLAIAMTFGLQATVMAAEVTDEKNEIINLTDDDTIISPQGITGQVGFLKGWLNFSANPAEITCYPKKNCKLWMTVGCPSNWDGKYAIADAEVWVYRGDDMIWHKVIPADDSVNRYLVESSCSDVPYKVKMKTTSDERDSYIVLTMTATEYL